LHLFDRSKKFQKSEKKPCQHAESSIMATANLTKSRRNQ
jgi:hypothetical protein